MRYILLAVFLLGCGQEKEVICDFVTDGACVVTNGFQVDPKMISDELNFIQNEFNRLEEYQNNPLVMEYLAEEYELTINYMPYPGIPWWNPEKEEWQTVRGLYRDNINTIYKTWPQKFWEEPLPEATLCQEIYYVLGHELLHFVDYKYLNATGGHDVDVTDKIKLFASYEKPSIEMNMYLHTADLCHFHPYGY